MIFAYRILYAPLEFRVTYINLSLSLSGNATIYKTTRNQPFKNSVIKKKSMENIFVRSFHYETIYFLLARLLRQMSTKYPLCIAPLCTTLLRNKDTSKRWNVTKLFRPRRGGGEGEWYISAKLIRRKKKNNNKNNKKKIYNGGFEYFFFFFFIYRANISLYK